MFNDRFIEQFTDECASERIIASIGQYLTKLLNLLTYFGPPAIVSADKLSFCCYMRSYLMCSGVAGMKQPRAL